MNCRHVFEERIYLISNRATASNPLFLAKKDQLEFLDKVEQYLEPICKVLAHALHEDQFQLLIRTKSRRHFTRFFRVKHKGKSIEKLFIPLSTHIFSRQMSNLQVSVAKKFNFRNNRSGALFAARFDRQLVENEQDMLRWIDRLTNNTPYFQNAKKWSNQIRGRANKVLNCLSSAKEFGIMKKLEKSGGVGGSALVFSNLGDCFTGMLNTDHLTPFLRKMMIEHRVKFPCGPNYN